MAEFEVERVGGELKRFGVEGSDVPFKVVSPYELSLIHISRRCSRNALKRNPRVPTFWRQ